MRTTASIRSLIVMFLVTGWLAAPAAQTPRPDVAALRAEAAHLQKWEQSALELRADLQSFLSPDVILLINPYGYLGPVPVPLARYQQVVTEWSLLGRSGQRQFGETVSQQVAMAIAFSNELKRRIREETIPDLDRELSQVRQQQAQVAQKLAAAERPPQPGQIQAAPPADAGEGWVLERALAGMAEGGKAQVLSQNATAAGGDVTLRNQVTATCSETWRMSWTFSPDIRFVYQGVRIRTTLTTQLVGQGCNYRNGSYLAIGEGTRMEGFIDAQVPPDRNESRVIESENLPRAQASSFEPITSATTSGELVVRRQPVRSPSYAVLRMYIYVPGSNLTIAYVFRAN